MFDVYNAIEFSIRSEIQQLRSYDFSIENVHYEACICQYA